MAALRSMVMTSGASLGGAAVWDDSGRSMSILPWATKVAVVSTIASNTSMMSMKGMTLMESNRFMVLELLPLGGEHFHAAQQAVVEQDGRDGHEQPQGGGLQRQRQAHHDGLHVDVAALAQIVEGDENAEHRAQQSDVRRARSDGGEFREVAGERH